MAHTDTPQDRLQAARAEARRCQDIIEGLTRKLQKAEDEIAYLWAAL